MSAFGSISDSLESLLLAAVDAPEAERRLAVARLHDRYPAHASAIASFATVSELRIDRDARFGPRYRLEREIGRGGVGVVWQALDLELRRSVAIKFLRTEYIGTESIARRFVEEARFAARVPHGNVVRIFDLGECEGRAYFAMELLRGEPLSRAWSRRRSLTDRLDTCLAMVQDVARAAHAAHLHGIVHRDLKPSNAVLLDSGDVKVVDWGMSKAVESSHAHSSGSTPLGTPAYMSPEQARCEHDRVDARSDVFALGAMLCELITAGPPYVAPGGPTRQARVLELAARAMLAPARARIERAPVRRSVRDVALRCLAANPEDRPPSAAAVADALRREET